MKYFIDTHDKKNGSFPQEQLSEAEFFAKFDALEEAAPKFGVGAHAAHVNLKEARLSASCRERMQKRCAKRTKRSDCRSIR